MSNGEGCTCFAYSAQRFTAARVKELEEALLVAAAFMKQIYNRDDGDGVTSWLKSVMHWQNQKTSTPAIMHSNGKCPRGQAEGVGDGKQTLFHSQCAA